MPLLEAQLFVKKSQLPGAGKGLYTKKAIPRGTRIVEYKGEITSWAQISDDHDNGYIFFASDAHVIDARNTPNALARYANDARGLIKVKGVLNNAVYEVDGTTVYIKSTKKITANSEIFVAYGKDYWDTVRENIAIDKANAAQRR